MVFLDKNCTQKTEKVNSTIEFGIFELVYNPGHNTLELYNILVQIQFTTSKRKLDIQYSKLGIRVASKAAERLKTQLENVRKISNLNGHIAQCLISLQELGLREQQLQNTQKQIPNFSFPVQFYWITPFVLNVLSGTVVNKFQLKLTILIFWTKFSQKEHFLF